MPYYVVHKGKKRGIFNSWEECKPNIFGCKKPIFKKFDNLEDAKNFLLCGFGNKVNESMANMGIKINNPSLDNEIQNQNDNGKNDEDNYGNDNNKNLKITDYEKHTENEKYNIINLFTDGSLIRQTKNKLFCGYGFYIPQSVIFSKSVDLNFLNSHNIVIPEYRFSACINDNKTNNRAELQAIIDGLRNVLSLIVANNIILKSSDGQIMLNIQIMKNMGFFLDNHGINDENNNEYQLEKPLLIKLYTDSKYSTLILDKTGEKYRKAGYILKGEEVKNADLVDQIMKIKDLLLALNIELKVLHVFSHTNMNTFEANGNKIADELANKGARNYNNTNKREYIIGRRGMTTDYEKQQIMNNNLIIMNDENIEIKNENIEIKNENIEIKNNNENNNEINNSKINPFHYIRKKKTIMDMFICKKNN
jgi:ribonuclease HI